MKNTLLQPSKRLLIFVSVFVFNATYIFCQGKLDLGFGHSGRVLAGFPSRFKSMAIQNDQIVVAGTNYHSGVIARYTYNGDLDSSFGANGVVNIPGVTIEDVATQNDDKILVAGSYIINNSSSSFLLMRYTKNGQPDASFGNNGSVKVGGKQTLVSFSRVIVQSDGKILCAGDFFVARFAQNGNLDPSFGIKGLSYAYFSNTYQHFGDCIVQPDGKIILLGNSEGEWPSFTQNFEMARLLPNGKPDKEFGQNGKITFTDSSDYNCLVMQSNGRIIAGGTYYRESRGIFRAFNSNGIPDNTFGQNGKVLLDIGTYIWDMQLQPDNKILAGGSYLFPGKPPSKFALWRLKTDGNTDSAFGNNGRMINSLSPVYAEARHVLLRPGDKILLSGYAEIEGYEHGAIAQYTNDVQNITSGTTPAIFNPGNSPVLIYPNPAKNYLRIEGLSVNGRSEISVVDLNGNIKLQVAISNKSYNLNIASLKTGNYILNINANGETISKKFMKE